MSEFIFQLLLIVGLLLLLLSGISGFLLKMMVKLLGRRILDRVKDDFRETKKKEEYEIVRDGSDFKVIRKKEKDSHQVKSAPRKDDEAEAFFVAYKEVE